MARQRTLMYTNASTHTLLMLDITDPPVTEQDRIARSRFNNISRIVHDPAVEVQGTSQWFWLDAVK
ncbi:MAG: hypothetical protein KC996_11580 [Phycisphaerales bacterium]|nr:hypothetical protein [Phycisphaerales bacterium]